MDVLTIALSALFSTICTFILMLGFYRFWILPYLTALTESVPAQCRALLEPYVKEQMEFVMSSLDDRLGELTKSVKTSASRFQRTVKTAAEALDLDEFDMETEEGQTAAREKLASRYGFEVASQAIVKIIQDIQNSKALAAAKPKEEVKPTW